MGIHHLALATRDLAATHRFYTEAMGFTLVKAVANPIEGGAGFAKHLFYDTGGDGMIAFWELNDDPRYASFDAALSTSQGLPTWVNHFAFTAHDRADLDKKLQRWLDGGFTVVEVDHEFCVSIYNTDPNGTMVEWCMDTRPLDERDRDLANRILADPNPAFDAAPNITVHRPPVVAAV
jgi:catechol 2,3-dioxygenase-like lactoylglutathione lyase family enzyme